MASDSESELSSFSDTSSGSEAGCAWSTKTMEQLESDSLDQTSDTDSDASCDLDDRLIDVRKFLENDNLDEGKRLFRRCIIAHEIPTESKEVTETIKMIVEMEVQGRHLPGPDKLVKLIDQKRSSYPLGKQTSVFNKVMTNFQKKGSQLQTLSTLQLQTLQLQTLSTFLLAIECGVVPDMYSYNPLLRVFQKERRGAYVMRIFEHMELEGILKDNRKFSPKGRTIAGSFMLSALLNSRSIENRTDKANKIIEEYGLDEHGIREIATFYAEVGRLSDVRELYEKYPSKFTGNELIKACLNLAEEDPVESAMDAVNACLSEEYRIFEKRFVTYSEMSILLQTRNEKLAPKEIRDRWSTLEQAASDTVILDEACFEKLCAVNQWSREVQHFLEKVSKQNSSKANLREVSRSQLSKIHKYLTKLLDEAKCRCCNQYEVAIEYFNDDEFLKVVMPDHALYNSMMQVCGKAGEPQEAERIFGEMKNKGIEPNRFNFNTLMDAYARAGMKHKVTEVLERMHSAGIESNDCTRSILLKCYDEHQLLALMDNEEPLFGKGMILTMLKVFREKNHLEHAKRLFLLGIKKGFFSPNCYENNTLDLHGVSCDGAEVAWQYAKRNLMKVHNSDIDEEGFSTGKNFVIDCGKSGYALRSRMKCLLAKDGLVFECEEQSSKLVIQSNSLKLWLEKLTRETPDELLKVKNLFFDEPVEKNVPNDNATQSTTDMRDIKGIANVRRKVPLPLKHEGKMFSGTICSYDDEKNYGFIECEEIRTALNLQVYMYKKTKGKFKVGEPVQFKIHFNKENLPQAKAPLVKAPLTKNSLSSAS